MRILLAALLALGLFQPPAFAQSQSDIANQINTTISPNARGAITANGLQSVLNALNSGKVSPDNGIFTAPITTPGFRGTPTGDGSQFTTPSAIGTVARSLATRAADTLQAADFGVVCDGATANDASMLLAVTAGRGYGSGRQIMLPPGTCLFSNTLVLSGANVGLRGAGRDKTIIKAPSGVLPVQVGKPSDPNPWTTTSGFSTSLVRLADLTVDVGGKSIGAIGVDRSATETRFEHVAVVGDCGCSLIYDQGDTSIYDDPFFYVGGNQTWGLEWDTWGHNQSIIGGTCAGSGGFGNGGSCIRITQGQYAATGADPRAVTHRVEGAKVTGMTFINCGPYNLQIGNSLYVQAIANVFDQITTNNVVVQNNADAAQIVGNYIGSIQPVTSKVGVYVSWTAGYGTNISNNIFYNLNFGVLADSNGSVGAPDIRVTNNNFNLYGGSAAIVLDSVGRSVVTGNIDSGTTTGGSFWTKASFRSGVYAVSGNVWSPNTVTVWDANGTYTSGNVNGVYSGTSRQTLNGGSAGLAYPANSTTPQYITQTMSTAEVAVAQPVPYSGTLRRLVVATNASPGSGQSYTLTLRVNGADTAVSCQITGANQSCADIAHTTQIVVGQTYSVKIVGSSGSAATLVNYGLELDAAN